TIAHHIQPQRRAQNKHSAEYQQHQQQHGAITKQFGSLPGPATSGKPRLGGIRNQSLGIIHLLHDRVTGVDAMRAAYALVLQSIANIDTGWADLHTQRAVDTISQAKRLEVAAAFTRTALLATLCIVGD